MRKNMIVTLKDITTKITKGTTPTSIGCKFEKSGINFIKSESLVDGKTIDKSKFAFISERTHERLKRSQIEENDILFSMAGMFLGKTGIATAEVVPANTNQAVAIIRVDDTKANYEYVYYYLNQKSVIHTINTTSAQSAQPNINLKQIGKIKINLPNRKKQDQIVSLLSAIDLKISNNVEINDNLQQQAFAAFDNLVANAENTDCNVSDYAFLNPKRALAKNQMARSIDMSRLSTSRAFPSGWEMKPFAGGMRFTNGDTLLARITPCLENGKTAFIDFLDDGEVAFGSTEYIVLAPKNDTPPEMLYCLARNPAFIDYAVKNMNGSSGRQRVSAETVGQYRLPLFDKHSLSIFREVVSPMF